MNEQLNKQIHEAQETARKAQRREDVRKFFGKVVSAASWLELGLGVIAVWCFLCESLGNI